MDEEAHRRGNITPCPCAFFCRAPIATSPQMKRISNNETAVIMWAVLYVFR